MKRDLLPGEYAVLGLLSLRPMHGYEMARYFDRDDLSEVCPLDQGLLYTYLRNVEERGLVSWQEMRVGLRPPRKLYQLTPAGRLSIDTWLRTPVGRMREVRLDLLLKLYFLRQAGGQGELALLERQIAICEEYRDALGRRAAALDGFQRLVATSKLSAAASTIEWLRAYAAEVGAQARGVR